VNARFARLGVALCLLLVLGLSMTVRWRLLSVPLERDEGEYAYMAQLINEGVPPYLEAYNMKLPGTYAAYALSLRCFGDDAEGIRIGLVLASAASVLLLFLLAQPLVGEAAALAAAAVYATLSLSPSVQGLFAHATHFVVLFALAGLVVLAQALRSGRALQLLAAGALLGLSILMKQNGVFFAALGLLQLAWSEAHARPRQVRRAAARIGWLALGVALPLVATGLLVLQSGAWPRFWFWVVSYGMAYASQVPLASALGQLRGMATPLVTDTPVLDVLALAGLAVASAEAWRARRPGFVLPFALVSAAAVCPSFWFRPHYFILLLPAASLLAATALRAMHLRLARALGAPASAALAVALVAFGAGQAVYQHRVVLLEASPIEVSRLLYDLNPFPESIEVAAYLREHTAPSERIAVIGSEPQLYFYADRRAATGYLYTYPLMEPQPFARQMQREMIGEIEGAQPAYVVLVAITSSWLARPDSDLLISDWTRRFLREHYKRVGVVEIRNDFGPSEYTWGEAAASHRARWPNQLQVWKRKG